MSSKKNIPKRLQRPVKILLADVMSKKSPADELQTPKQMNETVQGSSTNDVATSSSSMLKSYEQVNKDQGTSPDPSLSGQDRRGERAATAMPSYLVANVRR